MDIERSDFTDARPVRRNATSSVGCGTTPIRCAIARRVIACAIVVAFAAGCNGSTTAPDAADASTIEVADVATDTGPRDVASFDAPEAADARDTVSPIDGAPDEAFDAMSEPIDESVDARDAVSESGDASSDATPTDAAADATMASLFAPCGSDADCTPGFCMTEYPVPFCSINCTSSTECGPNGACNIFGGVCVPSCTSGARDCDRYGGMCYYAGGSAHGCVPACFTSTPPSGDPAICGASFTCDVQGIVPMCTTMPTTSGAPIGSPCTADGDCRSGRCLTGYGYLGGYCATYGRMPPLTDFTVGAPLPQSDCPSGAAPVVVTWALEGDATYCLATCTSSADCTRAGYACRFVTDGSGAMSTNGLCEPIDCTMSGMTCPSGTMCTLPPGAPSPGYCF